MTYNDDKILYETRVAEVQEIVGRAPTWIIRYGITLIGLLLLGIFFLAYMIKYPEQSHAKVIIEYNQSPVQIFTNTTAIVDSLYASQNSIVESGQVIATLTSMENAKEVFSLKKELLLLLQNITYPTMAISKLSGLGSLQVQYFELQALLGDYHRLKSDKSTDLKLNAVENQLKLNAKLRQSRNQTNKLNVQTSAIEEQQYLVDKKLYEQKAITNQEFLESQKSHLSSKASLKSEPVDIWQAEAQSTQLKLDKIALQNEQQKSIYEMKQKVLSTVIKLLSAIETWENTYVVKALVSGKLQYAEQSKPGQIVNQHKPFAYVIRKSSGSQSKGYASINNVGALKSGQKILIDLTSVPANENGYLEGTLDVISDLPSDSVYSFTIKLTNGLVSTTGKAIPPLPIHYGTGKIITKDISLLNRLFSKLNKR
jgi:multidrug efflux pump subunit AcrA (membrane-fusion protein)